MKPQKQAIPINFAGGLDLKTDPWQVGPTNFLALNNMVFSAGGRLTKRNGFGALGTTINTPNPSLTYSNVGGSLTNARKIFAYQNELLLNDAFNLYSYDEASNSWNYKGRSTMVGLSTGNIVAGATDYISCDSSIDTTTGIKVFAYCSSAFKVYYSIQDTATGQFLVNQAQFDSGALFGANYTKPRCVSISGKSWITAINLSDNKLYYQAIVGQTVTGSPTLLISNLYVEYIFTVSAANATAGATYTNNGHTFTVLATISSGTSLVTSGNGAPTASGTLTKSAGTGDATITFSVVASGAGSYDIDVDPFSGNIYIAYANNAQGITISAISSSFVVGNTISKSESGTHGVSFFGDGTNIWVVYNNGSATKTFIVNNAVNATTAAPTNIDSSGTASNVNNVTGVWSTTLSKAFIFYDPTTFSGALTETAAINFNTASLSGSTITAGTPNLFCGSLNINSKAFAASGIPHIVGIYTYAISDGSVIQSTNFLLNLYNVTPSMGNASFDDVIANIAAKISPDEASLVAPFAGLLSGIHQSSSGIWETALLQNSNYSFSTSYNPSFSPTGVIDCQFDFNLTNPDAQDLGNNANIASGQLTMYDGASVVEQNFHIYPNSSTYSIGTSGSISVSADSIYSYIYVYEWIDNEGQIHRSFPSPVVTPIASGQSYTFASGTSNGSVTLTIPTLRVTNKSGTQVVISVYRTLANGSVYFRLNSSYGTILNDPSVDSISFTDVLPDGSIEANIQLYTTGALGYFAPPATHALATFKNRLLAIPFEGGTDFLYSNQVLPNFPVQFVPFFDQNIGSIGGGLITIAGMDDKIIMFKSGKISGPSILYMVGQGPAPSGSNNDFTDPLPVAVDVGCVDRTSVVLTPVGLMFKSDKGIYLLSRSLEASYIGAQVEGYNQYSVVSAQLIPNSTQVRFLLSNGTLLMYDYFYKVWATFSNPAGISDCIFQGEHTYVSSTGQVYKETPGVYVDGASTPVLMNFTTSWIKLGGLQGYQRAFWYFLLGEYISPHQLSVSTYTNFSTNPDQTNVITPDSSIFLENWRGFFANQRCQSFQVSLQEVYTGTPGAAFTMSGINLIAAMKSPWRTISAAQSVG